ncbi:hypothetical protein HOLleu_42534 [Holothuria leucospilota]|uniref:Uncharacterized protein n=1 Tax=Holothuria leucospilota TaxID=206669 RepID=A0A9Q1BC44_HOLLE|nr:hypothetical protein HOLleu_42534 [Holothuria leucospilota]
MSLYIIFLFKRTGLLGNFQSHILAYASKRFAYSYLMYKARNLLAAIDYQKHKDRTQKVTDGKPVTPLVGGEDDPRRLASTIRTTQPPPTAELVKRHQRRF